MTEQTPKTYTKKPVDVEAMRWDGTAAGATPIIDWILAGGGTARYHEERTIPAAWPLPEERVPASIAIDTLEGTMQALEGDVIIRGVQGEFYPCKPDIFAETYSGPSFTVNAENIPRETFDIIIGPDAAAYYRIREAVEERFITAAGGEPPTDEQREAVKQFQQLTVELATAIEQLAPPGRNKSLALTHLEDALMRANRAIFATGPSA